MAEVPKIIDLHKVIEPHLNGATLDSYESQYLTKPGDNYGSLMLAIHAKVKQESGVIEDLPLIAKLPPLTNDLYWQIFQPERTCITENAVYKLLAPELIKIQLEAGVIPTNLFNGFPGYYGSRISLNTDATKVDRDAVLVQENLTARGYRPGNRHKPYDLAHAVLIMHYMAQYHALPLALRLKKPKVFDQFVRPYFKKFNMNDNMESDTKDVLNDSTLADIKDISNEDDVERVKELFDIYDDFQASEDVEDGLWTSIVHMDLWINNLMVKYDEDNLPAKLKIVDFQIAQYESVVHDVIFLLLSSVDSLVLEENYYNLLRIYYEAFIMALRTVNVDTKRYCYEGFLDEVKRVAHIQIPHALFMTKVIMADNNTLPSDYKDVDLTILTKNIGDTKIMGKISDILRLSKSWLNNFLKETRLFALLNVMDTLPIIQDLGQVIEQALQGGRLISYEVKSLTQPGDNYGSVLISILANIKQADGEIFKKRLVAKVPPTDPKYWQFIQPERTCLTENAVYRTLAPEISLLQTEAKIPKDKQFDGFALYYGSRISITPDAKVVDRDAVLVLDDLGESNYKVGNRMEPFDLPHTKLALRYMAQFHALTIALRLKKPNIFEMKVRPFFKKFDWHAAAPESKETMIAETLIDIIEVTNNDRAIVDRIRKLSYEFFSFLEAPPIENNPFNTIIHSDYWIMNLMFRHDSFGKPTHLKIIDFQTAQFDSVIHDLISFMFTSISIGVLEDNYLLLLKFYYNAFIESLNSVGANTPDYTYDAFYAELKRTAYIQVPHSIFMTRFILADDVKNKDKRADLSEVLKNTSSKRVHNKLSKILQLAEKFEILC